MQSNKRFSFVIPTYQSKRLIKNTLETLNRQDGFQAADYEVIVVDDGSTDGTGEVIQSMEKRYEFKYIYLERTPESSRSRARNEGIKAAEGEFVIFIDGDMLIKNDYLKELDKCFKVDENIIVIGNRINLTEDISCEEILYDNYYEYPKFRLDNFAKLETRHLNYKYWSYNAEGERNPWLKVYSCNLAVPKKFLDKFGGFDENFKGWGLEDVELGYRLYKGGAKIVISNKIEAFHQKYEKSGILNVDKGRYQEVDRNTLYFIKKHPEALKLHELVIIKLFRGQISYNNSTLRGIRKKVEINFNKSDNLDSIKDKILDLSKQKSLKIIVNDYAENTDLDIWIQLLGKRESTPLYYPMSKYSQVNKVMGILGRFNVKLIFSYTTLKGYLLIGYKKLFRG
jgi:glycosyltransferase involved in cell wall biosynthesis